MEYLVIGIMEQNQGVGYYPEWKILDLQGDIN